MPLVLVEGTVLEHPCFRVADGILVTEDDAHAVVRVVPDAEILQHVLVEIHLQCCTRIRICKLIYYDSGNINTLPNKYENLPNRVNV